MTISDPFRCIAECTKIGSSCNALIFDRCKKSYRRTYISTRQMPILREAGQCHLGWASPPCNKSEPTTNVFLARRISEFPCFSELFSTSSIKSLLMILNENSSFLVGSQTRSMEIIFQPFLGDNNKLFGYKFRVNCYSC